MKTPMKSAFLKLAAFAAIAISGRSAMAASSSPHTYKQGSRVYLDNGTVKVGLETAWGGAIVEFDWNGMNFVNAFDTGREVQVAFYDGEPYAPCGDCAGGKGWDPVQGGDWHKHGSPVLAQSLNNDSIYIKSQPHHWYPDNKGGPDSPVPGDLTIEQWVSFVPNVPNGVKVHYKITHFGNDQHFNSYQEFPAVYTNLQFNRCVYYGGTQPWTGAEVNNLRLPSPPNPSPTLYTPELWMGLVNDQNVGLTVFVPGQYPYATGNSRVTPGDTNASYNYFVPRTMFSFGPGSVLEADIYLFGGDYRNARQAIYGLKKTLPPQDPFAPDGYMDAPKRDAVLKGTVAVSGWAFDNDQVSEVDVLVDERAAGHANYGTPRADVAKKWPNAPLSLGFAYSLDTTPYSNGKHTVGVNVKDPSGNIAVFGRIPVLIQNPSTPAKTP
jgi:hypothetical protein